MKQLPLVLCGALLFAGLLNADTAYNNFGPGFDYTPGSGLGEPDPGDRVAVPFTEGLTPDPGFVYALSSITVAAYNNFDANDPGDPLTIALYSASSNLPDTLLASAQIVLTDSTDSPPQVVTVNFTGGPYLSQGAQYWVALSDPNGQMTWNSANTTGAGLTATYSVASSQWVSNGNTYTPGAMQVIATQVVPTPEPGTWLMLASGCIALVLLLGTRRRSVTAPEA